MDIQTRAHAALKIPKKNAARRLKYLVFWWDVTPRHLVIGSRRFVILKGRNGQEKCRLANRITSARSFAIT